MWDQSNPGCVHVFTLPINVSTFKLSNSQQCAHGPTHTTILPSLRGLYHHLSNWKFIFTRPWGLWFYWNRRVLSWNLSCFIMVYPYYGWVSSTFFLGGPWQNSMLILPPVVKPIAICLSDNLGTPTFDWHVMGMCLKIWYIHRILVYGTIDDKLIGGFRV